MKKVGVVSFQWEEWGLVELLLSGGVWRSKDEEAAGAKSERLARRSSPT
jgi:hypothetical protein